MFLLILTIGLLNLALGFALGMHLGYGPPGLLAAWDALGAAGARSEEPERQPDESGESRILPAQPADMTSPAADSLAPVDPNMLAAETRLLEEVRRLRAECEAQLHAPADPSPPDEATATDAAHES